MATDRQRTAGKKAKRSTGTVDETAPKSEADARKWRDSIENDRISFLVKEASRGFTRSLQVRLTEHGVSFGHYVFLRVLWVEDGITQRELSTRVGLKESTACRAIHSLNKLGYITRVKKPGNNKRVYVFLTPRGRWLKMSLMPVREEIASVAMQGITAADMTVVRRALVHIIDNLMADEARWDQSEMRLPSTRDMAKVLGSTT